MVRVSGSWWLILLAPVALASDDSGWLTGTFKVTAWGCNQCSIKAGVGAGIVNQQGAAAFRGGYLKLSYGPNHKHPVHYRTEADVGTLNPGEERMLYLAIPTSPSDTRPMEIELTLTWVDPEFERAAEAERKRAENELAIEKARKEAEERKRREEERQLAEQKQKDVEEEAKQRAALEESRRAERALRSQQEEAHRRSADEAAARTRVEQTQKAAAEAERRAAETRQRYETAMQQAQQYDREVQRQLAVVQQGGLGDAVSPALQASLRRMQASAELQGQSGAAQVIAHQANQLAQQQALVNGATSLAMGIFSIFSAAAEAEERREEARLQQEEAREERRRQAEQARQQAEALHGERLRLEQAAEAERRRAEEELARAKEESRRAQHLAVAATLKSDTASTLALKPPPGSAPLALKPLVAQPLSLKTIATEEDLRGRVEGGRYLRIFVDGPCGVSASSMKARPAELLAVPAGLSEVVVSSDCTGVVQLYVGREAAARGAGLFGRGHAVTVPIPR